MMAITTFAETPTTYALVVKFNSECCGVPDAAPLVKCIRLFKKKHNIKKISYCLISPMGKEGEYYMAFTLSELNTKERILFIKELNATTLKMKDSGSATIEENMGIDKTTTSSRTSFIKKRYKKKHPRDVFFIGYS